MKFLLSLCIAFISLSASGQKTLNPVKWKFNITKDGDEHVLTATADIDDKWAIYSQHTEEGGPVPTSFNFADKSSLLGATIEKSTPITIMSELFDLEVSKFKKKAVFEQRFKKKAGAKIFSGSVTFMSCDDDRCLPPTEVQFDLGL